MLLLQSTGCCWQAQSSASPLVLQVLHPGEGAAPGLGPRQVAAALGQAAALVLLRWGLWPLQQQEIPGEAEQAWCSQCHAESI